MNVQFKFDYCDFVTIKVFGLDCEGRVVRCINDAGDNIYDVQYAINGELRRAEFYEDEIELKKARNDRGAKWG